MHADELRFVNAQLPSQQTSLLTLLWSAKEAMYKWYGLGEVDFSEMMRTFPFVKGAYGAIDGLFMKSPLEKQLSLQYKIWDDVCLVWLKT